MWSGFTVFGDLTASLKTRKVWLFMKWLSLTITFGCIMIKPYSTCPSRFQSWLKIFNCFHNFQANVSFIMCHEVRNLPSWHSSLLYDDWKLWVNFSYYSFAYVVNTVSHTDHDLVFIWNMTDPLVVNPDIELPQLDISNNYTTDCTIEYSTGWYIV